MRLAQPGPLSSLSRKVRIWVKRRLLRSLECVQAVFQALLPKVRVRVKRLLRLGRPALGNRIGDGHPAVGPDASGQDQGHEPSRQSPLLHSLSMSDPGHGVNEVYITSLRQKYPGSPPCASDTLRAGPSALSPSVLGQTLRASVTVGWFAQAFPALRTPRLAPGQATRCSSREASKLSADSRGPYRGGTNSDACALSPPQDTPNFCAALSIRP